MSRTQALEQIVSWMRGTDLLELSYRKDSIRFELRLDDAGVGPPAAALGSCRLTPVCSPGVGLFRWGPPGTQRRIEEGGSIQAGERLGLLETGGEPVHIEAADSGRIFKILISEGGAVEYGQPLILLTPP